MEEHHRSLLAEPRFWVSAAFVIFFVIFGRKLWQALTRILDGRAAIVRAELDEAGRLRREAEALLADASRRRDAAMLDAKALLDNAQAEAARLAEASRRDAEEMGRRRERMASDRISAAEKAAVNQVRTVAAEVAARAAEQVIRGGLSDEVGAGIVDRAIAGLPAAFSGRGTQPAVPQPAAT